MASCVGPPNSVLNRNIQMHVDSYSPALTVVETAALSLAIGSLLTLLLTLLFLPLWLSIAVALLAYAMILTRHDSTVTYALSLIAALLSLYNPVVFVVGLSSTLLVLGNAEKSVLQSLHDSRDIATHAKAWIGVCKSAASTLYIRMAPVHTFLGSECLQLQAYIMQKLPAVGKGSGSGVMVKLFDMLNKKANTVKSTQPIPSSEQQPHPTGALTREEYTEKDSNVQPLDEM